MITVRRKPTSVPSLFNVLDDLWLNNFETPAVTRPAVNVAEFDKHFQLEFAAPGFEKSDFRVEVEKDQLIVSVAKEENTEEKNDQYTRREFRYGNFRRMFTLPDSVDAGKVEAHYENGILRVFLPKKETEIAAAKRMIEIK